MSATLHRIPQWKVELVNELYELAKKHKVIALADITGIPANHVQMLRKKLHGKAVLKVAKAKVALIALEKAGIDLKEYENYFTGQILLIFTDMNPFELNSLVEQHVTKAYYKPGEATDKEIMIPEGNTGISPGPILSVFGKLKVPTKVQGNVIHVAKDTVVAKPGDVVSPELSSLLQRLGMALKEIRLRLKFAYDGIVIPGDSLRLNIEEYEGMLRACALDGLKVAVEIVWPVPEAIELALNRAYRQSLMLAAEAGLVAPETAEFVVRAAELKALALAGEVSKLAPELGIQVAAPMAQAPAQPAAEEKKEEKKEEKEEEMSEESLAEGFSALFG